LSPDAFIEIVNDCIRRLRDLFELLPAAKKPSLVPLNNFDFMVPRCFDPVGRRPSFQPKDHPGVGILRGQ
jgi:hypothetical protein